MVRILFAQVAETPAGKPVGVPMPVAPVVLWVILVMAELRQTVGVEDAALTVLFGVTVIAKADDVFEQPLLLVT